MRGSEAEVRRFGPSSQTMVSHALPGHACAGHDIAINEVAQETVEHSQLCRWRRRGRGCFRRGRRRRSCRSRRLRLSLAGHRCLSCLLLLVRSEVLLIPSLVLGSIAANLVSTTIEKQWTAGTDEL